jgi:hypothetical protein
MTTTQHTIDANIRHNGADLLTRIVYQYEPEFDGLAFLFVVDARTLDDHTEPTNVIDWAQDWIECDGYDRARQHAEAERGEAVS